jgi:hypothetical protein
MTTIHSSTAILVSRLAQSGSSTGVQQTRGRETSAFAGPATLFASSTLGMRAAQLNALADEAGTAQQARQVKSLINEARTVADRAQYAASSAAKVTGTAANLTPIVEIKADHGDTITVSDGHTTATYTHSSGFDVQDFIDTVNNTTNLDVKASLTADKRLQLEATGVNSITVGGSADAEELASIGLRAETATGHVNAERQDLARAFDGIRDKIDAVKLEADGAPVTAASLGIPRASAGGGNFQSNAEITAALAQLDGAEKTIAEKFPAGRAPADRESFTSSAINVLSDGAHDLALAQPSESDALRLAAQTRTQLAGWRPSSIVGKPGEPLLRLFQ